MKKLVVYIMSIMLIFTSIKIPTYATGAVAVGLGEFLKGLGYSIVWSVGSDIGSGLTNELKSWLSNDKKYYDTHVSDDGNEFGGGGSRREPNYYNNNDKVSDAMKNYSLTTNKQFIDNSVTNKNTYVSYTSSVTENRTYSLIKDSFNTTNNYLVYNPVTNNYTEINNISYNNQFDTYYITNNEYNYYITNNYTYYSYYIINNETGEDSYCELYYELPDGRNSYDLEVSEVWGEYFVYDVVGYTSVVEDDGKTLALYHFDNSLVDSSYWQNASISGGSGVFDSAKFDYGYFVNNSINIPVPLNFDIQNYTLEFTVVVGNGSSPSDIFRIKNNGSTQYIKRALTNGIYSCVLQVLNGEMAFYINGVKNALTTSYYTDKANADYMNKGSFIEVTTDNIIINPLYNNDSKYGNYTLDLYFVIDELRISNCVLYSGNNITVPAQSFDTNQVLCLPEVTYDSLIAVQGTQVVSDYRIGGVRPTYPTNGYVYIYLEDDVVKDIQQFQNDGWYSVNGAIYTDGEWKDLKEYNLSTYVFNEDDYNSGDSGSGDSGGSGSDGSGGSGSDGSGGSGSDNSGGSNSDGSGGGLSAFLSGLGSIGDALLSILGKLMEFFGKAIELISGTLTSLLTVVPDSVSQLLVAIFPFIPEEWVLAVTLSLTLGVIVTIIRIFK